jgi:hypothetical protein
MSAGLEGSSRVQEFLRGSPASLVSCPENSFPARPQRGHPHGGSTETPRWGSFRTTGPRLRPGRGEREGEPMAPSLTPNVRRRHKIMTLVRPSAHGR